MEKNNHWWEFYLVRYFIGTVFGTIIIYYLFTSDGSHIKDFQLLDFSKIKFDIALYALIGLGYTYLASAPILVFHAFRASIFSKQKNTDNNSTERNFNYIIVTILFLPFFFFLILPCNLSRIIMHHNPYFIVSFALFYIIIGIQVYLIIKELLFKKIFEYYQDLARIRSLKSDTVREYKESYKHLREHGNAFLILLFELLLAIILYNISSKILLVIVLLLWILPSSSVWLLGTYLEFKLNYLKFDDIKTTTDNNSDTNNKDNTEITISDETPSSQNNT